nr:hypothetical protein [uncultured Hyphomonas sp.]
MISRVIEKPRPGLGDFAAGLAFVLIVKVAMMVGIAETLPVHHVLAFALVTLLMAGPTWYVVSSAVKAAEGSAMLTLGLLCAYAGAALFTEAHLIQVSGLNLVPLHEWLHQVFPSPVTNGEAETAAVWVTHLAAVEKIVCKLVGMVLGSAVMLIALAAFRHGQKTDQETDQEMGQTNGLQDSPA